MITQSNNQPIAGTATLNKRIVEAVFPKLHIDARLNLKHNASAGAMMDEVISCLEALMFDTIDWQYGNQLGKTRFNIWLPKNSEIPFQYVSTFSEDVRGFTQEFSILWMLDGPPIDFDGGLVCTFISCGRVD